MRLEQCDVDVCIRLHFPGHIEFDHGLLIVAGMLGYGKDFRSVFYADNGTASFYRRDRDNQFLARLVIVFICFECQHAGRFAAVGIPASFVVRPVEIAHDSGRMLAFLIFYRDEISTPFFITERELESTLAVLPGTDSELFDRFVVRIGYVISQATVVRTPPPIPIDFIDLHIQFRVCLRITLVVCGSYFIGIVTPRVELITCLLRRSDTGIPFIRRIKHPVRIDTEIARLFIDTGHKVRHQHTRSRRADLELCLYGCIPFLVRRTGYQFTFLTVECLRRIIEIEILITGKRGRCRDECTLNIIFQVPGCCSLQPFRMQTGIQRFAPQYRRGGSRIALTDGQVYLQTIRFDRFHTQAFGEADATHIYFYAPGSCRCICLCRHGKRI